MRRARLTHAVGVPRPDGTGSGTFLNYICGSGQAASLTPFNLIVAQGK